MDRSLGGYLWIYRLEFKYKQEFRSLARKEDSDAIQICTTLSR